MQLTTEPDAAVVGERRVRDRYLVACNLGFGSSAGFVPPRSKRLGKPPGVSPMREEETPPRESHLEIEGEPTKRVREDVREI